MVLLCCHLLLLSTRRRCSTSPRSDLLLFVLCCPADVVLPAVLAVVHLAVQSHLLFGPKLSNLLFVPAVEVFLNLGLPNITYSKQTGDRK
jgi:hypothetical protein